ncbi:hypothetical protein [Mariniluteicoccus flavus]
MRHVAVGLAAALLLASACTPKDDGGTRDPSITYGNPTPTQTSSTPTPTASPTPSTEELVRQTQAAYKIAFDEFERLSWAGGADEPSPKLKEVAEGVYLEKIMALLRDQKKSGFRIEGKVSVTRVTSAPGYASRDSDPTLTLLICEDRREVTLVERDGKRSSGTLAEGYAYAKRVNGRVKLVDIRTQDASKCT